MELFALYLLFLFIFITLPNTCICTCDTGFVPDLLGDLCYMFVNTKMAAQDAQNFCNSRSTPSNLPIFNSQADFDNFHNLSLQTLSKEVDQWAGISRLCGTHSTTSAFLNIDGSSISFSNWESGQPNNLYTFKNLSQEQTCIYMDSYSYLQWNDVQCTEMYQFACQYRQSVTPNAVNFTAPICSTIGKFQQCPYGWAQSSIFPQRCFLFTSLQTTSWQTAVDTCTQIYNGSTIPIFHLADRFADYDTFTSTCNKHRAENVYMRYDSIATDYIWVDTPISVNFGWAANYPTSGTDLDCGVTDGGTPLAFLNEPCLLSTSKSITCQLTLSSPDTNVDSTCSFVPLPGFQQICNQSMTTPDGRVWLVINAVDTWSQAFTECLNRQSVLVRPTSFADIQGISQLSSNQSFWIGTKGGLTGPTDTYWYDDAFTQSTSKLVWAPQDAFTPLAGSCYYYNSTTSTFQSDTACQYTMPTVVCERQASRGCTTYDVGGNGVVTICDGFEGYVQCNNGYYLYGITPRICITNSTGDYWLTDAQQCYAYCAEFNVTNGQVFFNKSSPYDIYSLANTTCNVGYTIVGSLSQQATSYCQPSGQWNSIPECRNNCPDLALANGFVSYSNNAHGVGDNATFSCNAYYQLDTNVQLTCQANMTWDNTVPTCSHYCDSSPCANGICTDQPSTFSCNCTIGYFGTACDQTNFCILGPIQSTVQSSARRKRSTDVTADLHYITDTLQVLDSQSSFQSVMTLIKTDFGCAVPFTTDCLINKTFDQLNQIVNPTQQPQLMNLNSQCAPNAICISGVDHAVCVCKYQYFGDTCAQRNCSGNELTSWGDCSILNCDESDAGVKNRTYVDLTDCVSPTVFYTSCSGPCAKTDPLSTTERNVVVVVQYVGCAILLGLLIVVFLIFAVFRIMSLERMLQMCQEISLIIAHSTIIVTMKITLDRVSCCIVGMVLQFSILSNFTFLTLEAIQTYCLLKNVLSEGGFFNWKFNLLLGFGIPLGITGLTASIAFKHIRSTYSCWLNLGHGVSLGTLVPIIVTFCLATVLTEAATMGGDTKRLPLMDPEKFIAAMITQKIFFLKLTFNMLSFTFGTWAMYAQKIPMYGAVFAFNVTMGFVIFFAHTAGDEMVIEFLKEKMVCIKALYDVQKTKHHQKVEQKKLLKEEKKKKKEEGKPATKEKVEDKEPLELKKDVENNSADVEKS